MRCALPSFPPPSSSSPAFPHLPPPCAMAGLEGFSVASLGLGAELVGCDAGALVPARVLGAPRFTKARLELRRQGKVGVGGARVCWAARVLGQRGQLPGRRAVHARMAWMRGGWQREGEAGGVGRSGRYRDSVKQESVTWRSCAAPCALALTSLPPPFLPLLESRGEREREGGRRKEERGGVRSTSKQRDWQSRPALPQGQLRRDVRHPPDLATVALFFDRVSHPSPRRPPRSVLLRHSLGRTGKAHTLPSNSRNPSMTRHILARSKSIPALARCKVARQRRAAPRTAVTLWPGRAQGHRACSIASGARARRAPWRAPRGRQPCLSSRRRF